MVGIEVWGPMRKSAVKNLKIFKHSRCADIDLRIRKPMHGHRLKGYNCHKQKPNGAAIESRGEILWNSSVELFGDPISRIFKFNGAGMSMQNRMRRARQRELFFATAMRTADARGATHLESSWLWGADSIGIGWLCTLAWRLRMTHWAGSLLRLL
jgi:hypothetical protein